MIQYAIIKVLTKKNDVLYCNLQRKGNISRSKIFHYPGKKSLNSVIRNSYPLDELQSRSLLCERAIHRRETARVRAVSSGEKTSVGMKKNQG